jgi:hypothetical protein
VTAAWAAARRSVPSARSTPEALGVVVEPGPAHPGGGVADDQLLVEGDLVEGADGGEAAGPGGGGGGVAPLLLLAQPELDVLAASLERPKLAGGAPGGPVAQGAAATSSPRRA